jgi:hypothetical protein
MEDGHGRPGVEHFLLDFVKKKADAGVRLRKVVVVRLLERERQRQTGRQRVVVGQ